MSLLLPPLVLAALPPAAADGMAATAVLAHAVLRGLLHSVVGQLASSSAADRHDEPAGIGTRWTLRRRWKASLGVGVAVVVAKT